jgi:hypothetical protein
MKLMKFKKGGGNYAVFYFAGFFFKKNLYEQKIILTQPRPARAALLPHHPQALHSPKRSAWHYIVAVLAVV